VRIGVIGAGAIGGTIAALLDRAGHEVQVTARGAGLAAIAARGLRFDGAWGEHTAQCAAAETLIGAPELAFITTKAQDAEAAIAANRDALRSIPVVVVQNGLHGLERAARLLPGSDCSGALALYAAQYVEPGHVTVTAPGSTYIGAGTSAPTAGARAAAELLAQVMPAETTDNFAGCQWTKLVINMVNAVPAATGMSVQDTIRHPRLSLVVTRAMREAVQAGRAHGIRFGDVQGLNERLLGVFMLAPLPLARLLPAAMARRMGSTPNLGSTLQSIRRGQATEIDHLSGAVVEAAQAHGGDAPVNRALVAAVHEVERTGRFIAPEELLARIGT
jgi:2-dehydropantoate 2-reductase